MNAQQPAKRKVLKLERWFGGVYMCSLSALLENCDSVWVCCRNEDLANRFLMQCEKEGFLALNGDKPTTLFRHRLYGIYNDMTMGYLSNMIWHLAFQSYSDKHVRIDYEKFIADENDYTIL